MSSVASFSTFSGWSSAIRYATRPPRSCPATKNCSKPSCRITSTWSRAIARFEYGAWSSVCGGFELSPYPRMSAATTVNSSASRGAILCHMTWVCGLPCSSSSGGPLPPCRSRICASPVSMVVS